MVLVVLCHGSDVSALWCAELLRARSGVRVEIVVIESLNFVPTSWRHELGFGEVRTEIGLAGGRRLATGEVAAVLNRMIQPPDAAISAAVPEDADYARSELVAFTASWLRALAPRIVNQPTPQGLCGRWRMPLQCRALALEARLPVAPLRLDSERPPPLNPGGTTTPTTVVLTVGGRALIDGMPTAIRDGVRRFATLAQTPILGLSFEGANPAHEGWRFVDATPYPDLTLAGEAGIEAIAAELFA